MNKRAGLPIIAAVAALLLVVPTAAASTEAGWGCTADDSKADWTLLAAGSSFSPIPPIIPPEGPKVIVGWGVRVGTGLGPLTQRLEVFEVQNEAGDYKKIGESALETVAEGTNSFLTRIPVTEGDSVGLYGPVETLFCENEDGAVSLLHEGAVAIGETKPFEGVSKVGTPVRVVVEDDRDGDGYGDQSQDGCPESALYQSSCPFVALNVLKVSVRRRAILITVSNNTDASIQALGEVRWQVLTPPIATATGSTVARPVRVGLSSGPVRQIGAETPIVLRVLLPKKVRKHLEELPRRRALKARIDVKATNLANFVGTQEIKVKLPGQKPRR